MRFLFVAALAFLVSNGADAADSVLLQQTVQAEQAGRPWMMVDRAAVTSVVVEKGQDLGHRVSITFHPESRPRFIIQCNDPASSREVLDALRPGGPAFLDVTARCRF